MSEAKEFNERVKGREFQAVILFADIMNASEISNNVSIAEYAGIINQFHKRASDVYEFIGLQRYQNNSVEMSLRGDEVCLILHSLPLEDTGNEKEKIDAALKRDIRNAILFAIAIKLLWRASAYNQSRINQDLFPRDLGVGIHQGPVYFYKDNNLPSSLNKNEASEGYALNLAKRIETESRNGKASKILVSGSVRYWSEKIPIPVTYGDRHIPQNSLKGISTEFSLYEITKVEDIFRNFIGSLMDELAFDKDVWEKYVLLKEKNPDDFWSELLLKFKSMTKEEKPTFTPVKKEQEVKISKKDVSFYLSEAAKFYDMGNYDEIISYCTKAIELDPKYAFAYNNRGVAYAHKKEDDRAIEDYTKAIDLDPKFAIAYNGRGYAYAGKKEYDRAIEDCTKAIELDPKYAFAYYNRGYAYTGKKEYDKAIEDYTKAIELDPKYAFAYNGRGYAYTGKKEYDKAIEDYTKAIELDPKYASAHNNIGYAYFDLNKFQYAEKHFFNAIEIDNKHADAFVGLTITYWKLGEKEKAKENYKKAIEIEPKYAGKVDELMKETEVFYSENQLQAIKELLKELGY